MIEYRTLAPSELEAWYAHCHSVFTEDEPGYFKGHFEMDPWGDTGLIFVALEDGDIVSTVRVFRRTAWLNGRAVGMGGIGEVSTTPDYRRRGLAGSLLEMAILQMRAQAMPLSVLFGGKRMYMKAGWRPCPVWMTAADASGLPDLGDPTLAVRPFEPADLPYLMGMYDLSAARLNCAVIRTPQYWTQWVLPQWTPPSVLVHAGMPVAYCACLPAKDKPLLRVRELAFSPRAEEWIPGFLGALCRQEGCGRVMVHKALARAVSGDTVALEDGMMIRLNTPAEGFDDSCGLMAGIGDAGLFAVDHF